MANQLRVQAQKLIAGASDEKVDKIQEAQHRQNILKGELQPVGSLETPPSRNRPAVEKSARELQVEESIRILMIENGILSSLAFSTLTDRRENVEVAYRQTFEWIYEDSRFPDKSWSNLLHWLKNGSGIYWVNGKAGSGKSTLMRYIYDHPKTRVALNEWAGSKPCGLYSFFFWNSGDLEQRSQPGLLRSLLFEILQRHRDLLPDILPATWDSWSSRVSCIMSTNQASAVLPLPPEPKPLTLPQLKHTFRTLLKTIQDQGKLLLLIDGLDEYDGEYDDIAELFANFAEFSHVKFCLSSRPLVVFERHFASFPGLKLQNLTHGDISHYVKDKLGSHPYMIQQSQQHTVQVSHLINEIVEKASGVFLWVKLVVRSLLHGLRDYNRISDLQRRVRHLPADLEALYAHMLGHTDPFYHEQASQIFQIFRTAKKQSRDRITLLNLSWADDEDLELAENALIRPISMQDIITRCDMMDARLKSVCVGLLESADVQFSSIAPDRKVSFLHRTVSDFFAKAEVWDSLLSRTRGTGFSPNLSMLRSCVLQLKTFDVNRSGPLDTSIIVDALKYAKEAESDLDVGFPKLLDQLDIAASYQWRMMKSNGSRKIGNQDLGSIARSTIIEDTHYSRRKISDSVPDYHGHGTYHREELQMKPLHYKTRDSYSSNYSYHSENSSGSEDGDQSIDVAELEDPVELEGGDRFSRSSILRAHRGIKSHRERFSATLARTRIDREDRNLSHWSSGIIIPGIKPAGKSTTFYQIAKEIGLSHYVEMKFESGIIVDQDVNQYLLMNTISSCCKSFGVRNKAPDPALVSRLLQAGADPNLSYSGATPWENAMTAAASHFASHDECCKTGNQSEWEQTAREWAEVFELCIAHKADPNAQGGSQQKLSPMTIVNNHFPEFLSQEGTKLEAMLKERGAKMAPIVDKKAPNNIAAKESTYQPWSLQRLIASLYDAW